MAEYGTEARRNRVFILGAGFSAAAGIPMMGTLLDETMKRMRDEEPGFFEMLDRHARLVQGHDEDEEVNYRGLKFPDFCDFLEYIELREYAGGERRSDYGCREKTGLRYFLARTIAEHTPARDQVDDLYLQFADQLHPQDYVITFNWDTLLETALLRLGKDFTYVGEVADKIKVCKFHGSINWLLDKPSPYSEPRAARDWQPMGYLNPPLVPVEMWQSRQLVDSPAWRRSYFGDETNPFLVLPGAGKSFDVRWNAWQWCMPENFFTYTHDVYIIGHSLAPDDYFVRSFFLHNLTRLRAYIDPQDRKITIIDKNPEVADNYGFVMKGGRAEFLSQPFSVEHVAAMRERLEQRRALSL